MSVRVANYAGVLDEAGAGRCARAGLHINLVLATVASLIFLAGGRHLLALFSESPRCDFSCRRSALASGALPVSRRLSADAVQCHPRHIAGETAPSGSAWSAT